MAALRQVHQPVGAVLQSTLKIVAKAHVMVHEQRFTGGSSGATTPCSPPPTSIAGGGGSRAALTRFAESQTGMLNVELTASDLDSTCSEFDLMVQPRIDGAGSRFHGVGDSTTLARRGSQRAPGGNDKEEKRSLGRRGG